MTTEKEKSLTTKQESPLTTYSNAVVSVPMPKSKMGMFHDNFKEEYGLTLDGRDRAYEKACQFLTQDLQDMGLLGEHELLSSAVVKRGLWGSMKGEAEIRGFLFFIKGDAKIEGEQHTVSSIQFAWKPNEKDILVTEVPVDKLIINEDPSTTIPHVSFTFETREFLENKGISYEGKQRVYEFGVKQFPHVLDYLKKDRLAVATLTVSSGEELKGLPINRP